jgi:steroid delta-isomerase-like uncharacterized protein
MHADNRTSSNITAVAPALNVVAEYSAALAAGDAVRMAALRAPEFRLDWVHGDAFEDQPLSQEETNQFWPSWLAGFPEMDYEITRTIAGETVCVVQWVFTGVHAAPLTPPIFDPPLAASDRVIRLRGVSIYDVADGLIQRETTYLDLATLMVELGVRP